MRTVMNTTRGKVLASAAVVAAAASVAGLGTFGSFTSTTSASASVASGTVDLALGTPGAANRIAVAATGIVPGDTIQRAAVLTNGGSQDMSAITLTTAATTSSLLDTDVSNGLQVKIDKCSTGWVEAGTAPAYTYTCGGTTTTVLATRPVVGANLALTCLSTLNAAGVDNLRVTVSLPTGADNTFQNKSSVIGFTFTGTQRTGTAK